MKLAIPERTEVRGTFVTQVIFSLIRFFADSLTADR